MSDTNSLDLLFLGSGNAFGANGHAFSSFLLNGRYLFDCGPTVMQQLQKAAIPSNDIDVVFISHFHADHFFGLPFIALDGRYKGRSRELVIVGPPGIEQQTEALLTIGYPQLIDDGGFPRRYLEVHDGIEAEACGIGFSAARVEHVPNLECYAYRAEIDGRSVVYSGDTILCGGLLRLVSGADVVVTECSSRAVPVHLSPAGVAEVAHHAPGAKVIVTHLDGLEQPGNFEGLIVAEDLARYTL
ncbi:MAG TPA: ribonuclease Z [Dehalococcoidia bacterium]|nr:ribonuclease Z [Dehalococcoidia bacterium]